MKVVFIAKTLLMQKIEMEGNHFKYLHNAFVVNKRNEIILVGNESDKKVIGKLIF